MRKFIFAFLLVMAMAFPVQAAERYSVDLIDGVKKKDTIDFIVNDLMFHDFSVMAVNDYQIIARRDATDFTSRVFYGSRFNNIPEIRLEINLIQLSTGLRITATEKIITNPNSAFEKSSSYDNAEVQTTLNYYKDSLESKNISKKRENGIYSSQFEFTYSAIQGSNALLVRGTINGGTAYGILFFGDKIIKFNNEVIKNIDDFTSSMNSTDVCILTVLRSGEEKIITFNKNEPK